MESKLINCYTYKTQNEHDNKRTDANTKTNKQTKHENEINSRK